MVRYLISVCIQASVLTVCVLFALVSVYGASMQSSNFKIQSDSVNFGGGFSSSTNYQLESTAGEIATGEANSTSYALKAGYQQMHEVYIALSGIAPVPLSPSIPGISGGFSNGSTTLTVTTDSSSGYGLSIRASQNPSMQKGGDTIADYSPVGANPDFVFTTDATDAHLGYTPEGSDIVSRYLDNGSLCGTGSGDTTFACWDGLATSDRLIASKTSANHPSGSTTTVHFRVGVGGSVYQAPGTYTATTTVTALPL